MYFITAEKYILLAFLYTPTEANNCFDLSLKLLGPEIENSKYPTIICKL